MTHKYAQFVVWMVNSTIQHSPQRFMLIIQQQQPLNKYTISCSGVVIITQEVVYGTIYSVVGWVQIPELDINIKDGVWNEITISDHFDNDTIHYDSLQFNDEKYQLNKSIPSASLPPSWAENYIQVGFQINGNKAIRTNHSHGVDPVSVFLDEVRLRVR